MYEDLIGKIYGQLTIIDIYIKKSGKKNKSFAKCKCSCGNIKDIRLDHIKSGYTSSCGCLQKKIAKQNYKNLLNKTFGYWTVIEKVESDNPGAHWRCKCICGNEKILSGRLLTSNQSKSCGCKTNKMKSDAHLLNLVNQRFGKLVVIQKTEDIGQGAFWECQCDCGSKTIVRSHSLISGSTQSCGCNISRGEEKIENLFIKNNVKYTKQKTFKDLKGLNNGLLRFDFCFYNKDNKMCLLEYQGVQHYKNQPNFKSPKEHDKLKRQYCIDNNILLIEIPYTDFDKINWNYLKEKCNL